jgi:hypothetical protein
MENGLYKVYRVNDYEKGEPILGNEVGKFSVQNDEIIAVSGQQLEELLVPGPITGMNYYRISHTLNNGYFLIKKS